MTVDEDGNYVDKDGNLVTITAITDETGHRDGSAGYGSAVAAVSTINGGNGQIPAIVAMYRIQLSFLKMALLALERIESILVGSQIHESAMRETSTPVSASRTPPSPQLINN